MLQILAVVFVYSVRIVSEWCFCFWGLLCEYSREIDVVCELSFLGKIELYTNISTDC